MAKTIEEIKALKQSAEIELHDAVTRIYARFAYQSGIYPQSVTVNLTEVTNVQSTQAELVVCGVSLDITL